MNVYKKCLKAADTAIILTFGLFACMFYLIMFASINYIVLTWVYFSLYNICDKAHSILQRISILIKCCRPTATQMWQYKLVKFSNTIGTYYYSIGGIIHFYFTSCMLSG